MCRLFGLSAAPQRVRATFWLLDASDSLAVQSRREPDGVGLGIFRDDGTPEVHKAPVAAYRDADFAREARELRAATFIAHIRYASTGGRTPDNTHPFCQHDRLLAHNGVIGDLPKLEGHLGNEMKLVHGDTDSERLFALITSYAEQTGDLGEAITRAVRWVAADRQVTSTIALDERPARPLSLADLSAHAQASQQPSPAARPAGR